MHNDNVKRKNDRHSEPFAQPRTPEGSMRGAEGLTDGKFTDLNRKPAEYWACPPEVNKALAEITPGHPLKMGASSSIKEHAPAKIPSEGGPDSQRDGGHIPNRHA